MSIGVAYKAKTICSGVFISNRHVDSIRNSDLIVDDLSVLRHIEPSIDYETSSVIATFLGFIKQKAVYRGNKGCALVFDGWDYDSPIAGAKDFHAASLPSSGERLTSDDMFSNSSIKLEIDRIKLDRIVEEAFSEPDQLHQRRTRAVLVVHQGLIVAERYAPDITPDTPLIGWSMTKSVMNAFVGILVKQGRLTLDTSAPVDEWRKPTDPRKAITINHLLHMSSGLKFKEDVSDPLADATYMLLAVPDMAKYAADMELESAPGTKWMYSSGTSNIIARVIRNLLTETEYLTFPYRELFYKIGMNNSIIETDTSGTFVGSSFMYATARDWARFGLLYLNDGVWEGQRILPEGWVTYSQSPAPADPKKQYGAHFWLEVPEEYRGDTISLPADAFHAVGHDAQFVTIVPSYGLVIVRLGLARYPEAWDHERFVGQIIDACVKSDKGNTMPDYTAANNLML